MNLKEKLQQDMKDALRAGDKTRLGTIRLANAGIQQREIDEQITLDDAGVLAVLQKMIKQRVDAAGQFKDAGRIDLETQERAEIKILQAYLPEALSDAELDAMVNAAVAESGAESMRDMGKVMGILKDKVQGRADMGNLSARVKARLA
jgi:uncharacterized protein YqeY